MKRGQTGFTVVELLLVLILVSILGFTGYYVYHSQKNTNSTYNKVASVGSKSSATSPSTKFVFKELGVEFDQPSSLKGLSYIAVDGNMYITDSAFKAALNKCSDANTAAGDALGASFTAISKKDGQYPSDANPVDDGTLLKQFPSFYISFGVPNGNACSDLSQSQNLHDVADQERGYFVDQFKATATEVK